MNELNVIAATTVLRSRHSCHLTFIGGDFSMSLHGPEGNGHHSFVKEGQPLPLTDVSP